MDIKFRATEIGYYEEYDTISCGASNAVDNEEYHYINFQRPVKIGCSDDQGIYFEIDDQINGGYNTIQHCKIAPGVLTIKFKDSFEKLPGATITIEFSSMNSDGLLPINEGLRKVFIGYEDAFTEVL